MEIAYQVINKKLKITHKMNKQETILKAVGLSEEQVYSVVFETAIEYLERKAEDWSSELSKSKVFWIWWKYHWSVKDDQFLSELKGVNHFKGVENIRKVWIGKHMESMLSKAIPEPVWRDTLKVSNSDMLKFAEKNITVKEAVGV